MKILAILSVLEISVVLITVVDSRILFPSLLFFFFPPPLSLPHFGALSMGRKEK
jgi:hypothetical protein